MKLTVTVVVGDAMDPIAGFSKEDFIVAPEDGGGDEYTREALATLSEALDVIDAAKTSIERQARTITARFGSGPG
ncbi:MAG: hypothetical protein LC798_13190 [Chloroflexi bacterium]|nr:hypothetical protein [Chloroflexota bacterium]